MEQVRLIAAITLSIIVFLVWSHFFAPQPQEAPEQPASAEQTQPAAPGPVVTPAQPPAEPTPQQASPEDRPAPAAEPHKPLGPPATVTVDTPLFTAEISEERGALTSLLLHDYREGLGQKAPFKQMIQVPGKRGTAVVDLIGQNIPGLSQARYTLGDTPFSMQVSDRPRTVSLSYESPQGLVVTKEFVFSPDSYVIDLVVTVSNRSGQPVTDSLAVWLGRDAEPQSRFIFEGPVGLINNHFEEYKVGKIEKRTTAENTHQGQVAWVGLTGRYFLSAVAPDKPQAASARLDVTDGLVRAAYVHPQTTLGPGQAATFTDHLYFGPKKISILKETGFGLARAVDFGFFDMLAKPLLWLMNQVHEFIPNYGVAIIIMTILVKLALWPLGNKSYKSMNQMKKLQPLMAELREKYKDDKKKMNEEIFALYRTYKVNPASGCLPMLLQIPIFIALYRMLYEAIELRHAPFVLWINDLSAPDRLGNFGFSLPYFEPPTGLPVLTLIMGASMFFQQKMSPPPGDPAQAKMMMLLPVVFTFIFVNFPSGLVLYWLVNNLISMGQQKYVAAKSE